MYATAAPRTARWIARLPVEAWSPGLGRMVRISEAQATMLRAVSARHPWRMRELAEQTGYADAAGASRALRQLDRLGLAARSSTRGRLGSTVAWARAGARLPRALADLMRAALSLAQNVSTPSEGRDNVPVMADTFTAAPFAIPAGRHLIRDPESGLWRAR